MHTHAHTHPKAKEIIARLTCYNFTLFALLLFRRSQSLFQCNYVIRAKDYKHIETVPSRQLCSQAFWMLSLWQGRLYLADQGRLTRGSESLSHSRLRLTCSPSWTRCTKGAQIGAVSGLSCCICSSFRIQSKCFPFKLAFYFLLWHIHRIITN